MSRMPILYACYDLLSLGDLGPGSLCKDRSPFGGSCNFALSYLPGREKRNWDYIRANGRCLDNAKFEEFKTRSYTLEGWDTRSGWPKRKTLESLGLKFVADELEKIQGLTSMGKFHDPTRELAVRILTEVGFEDPLNGFSLRERAGAIPVTLYSFQEVVFFLNEPHPCPHFNRTGTRGKKNGMPSGISRTDSRGCREWAK